LAFALARTVFEIKQLISWNTEIFKRTFTVQPQIWIRLRLYVGL